MVQRVGILVHPYFTAYHTSHCDGAQRAAEKDCGRLGRRYRDGIRYVHAQDGLLVLLRTSEDYEPQERLVRYARTTLGQKSVCIAETQAVADEFLQERVTSDDELFIFGEDIAACVTVAALRYHDLLRVRDRVTILGNYCGWNVPNLSSAWEQIQNFGLLNNADKRKIKVSWF